ncbi:MAG TPA: thioesterase family protein [Trebonia sp.]|jgi:acyl-CoA thioesterase|nr:thioesterase family protein [Trebonia sp.]
MTGTEAGTPEAEELPAAYYLPGPDGVFEPTLATESPWSSDAQHGGPPTALLAHVMRTRLPADGMRIARITNEFLGTIPRVPLTTQASVIRDGRRIRLIEASLLADGRPVAIARAWQIATSGGSAGSNGTGIPAEGLVTQAAPPLPEAMPQKYFSGFRHWGYGESIEWRWVRGSYDSAGEAVVWARPRIPLVAGEHMHPLERVLVVADSANGVSSALNPTEWLFIPPAITVTLHRYPESDWVYLAATSTLAADGLGSTLGTLGDMDGQIGSVAQPLLVARQ